MSFIASRSHSLHRTADPGPKGGRKGPWVAVTQWLRTLERRACERRAKKEEAYLAQAVDIADLERRMRDLERGERQRFIGYF